LKVRGFSSLFLPLHHSENIPFSLGKTKNSTTTAGVAVKNIYEYFRARFTTTL
jgi:hypothetical protein